VGNDSGITHLAAASGVKTLALFGPTDPCKWGPRGKNVTTLHAKNLDELSVTEVAATISRLLEQESIEAST
jgi:heptosyltransferase III